MTKPIEITDLCKSYSQSGWLHTRHAKTVLHHISLSLEEGEVLGLVGESGCGKTTLAKVVLGLEGYEEGSVQVSGAELKTLDKAGFKKLRRTLQVVFQDPYSSLDPRMSVRQILCEPWDIHGLYKDPQARQKALKELLASVGLSENQLSRYPHEFSGGQRQRIAIARALALEPHILVADEPVSALDVSVQAQILNLLKDIRRARALSLLFISHDFAVARFLCDRIAVMYKGYILELAPAAQLLADPQHPYTETLLSAVPLPDPEKQKKRAPVLFKTHERRTASPCPFARRCPYYRSEECNRKIALQEVGPRHYCACVRLPFKTEKSRYAI